jgi:uncharacterized membrane protein (DUF4010 family)
LAVWGNATASSIALLQAGTIDTRMSAFGIIVASMASIIIKFPLAYFSNNRQFFFNVVMGAGLMMLAGIITAVLFI